MVKGNTNEMWKMNKQFLDEQISPGKSFNLTHDPTPGSPTYSGFYKQEIDYLDLKGYEIAKKGDYWHAFKK